LTFFVFVFVSSSPNQQPAFCFGIVFVFVCPPEADELELKTRIFARLLGESLVLGS
jgi:hypothetical protein